MARRFNGTSDFIVFTLPSTLQAVTAGSTTIVVVANFTDGTDGAMVHTRTSGGTNCWWMETFSNVWNYGQGTTAKNVGGQTNGSWAAYIGRKTTGGANAPRGRKIIFGGSTTDTTAGTGLADGTAPGVGGILQVGKWGTASEFISADVAAVAVFDSDLSDATTATFTTWANILAASPKWAVHFDQANATDAITDATGNGGNSSSITGTTIVANPSGFFAASGASPAGLAIPLSLGTPTIALGLSAAPSGLALGLGLGAPASSIPSVSPTGLAIPLSLGTPQVAPGCTPSGLAIALTLGQPGVSLGLTAAPPGLALGLALGTPSVQLARSAAPGGLAVPVGLGQPGVGVQAPYRTAVLTPGAATAAALTSGAAATAALTPGAAGAATLTAGTL